jgi:hypothetical protein
MPITIDGTGNISGLVAGGLPDGSINNADLATDAVSTSKILNGAVTTAKMGSAEQSGLAKAWVNFNGTGTVAIRASYNVSSITDNGTGDYTVNFTTAMVDANYSLSANSSNSGNGSIDDYAGISAHGANSYLAGSVRIGCVRWRFDFQVMFDSPIVSVAIFR